MAAGSRKITLLGLLLPTQVSLSRSPRYWGPVRIGYITLPLSELIKNHPPYRDEGGPCYSSMNNLETKYGQSNTRGLKVQILSCSSWTRLHSGANKEALKFLTPLQPLPSQKTIGYLIWVLHIFRRLEDLRAQVCQLQVWEFSFYFLRIQPSRCPNKDSRQLLPAMSRWISYLIFVGYKVPTKH